jgi:hypothetical protein
MNINLHIERLVLDGLNIGHGQGALVKAAVEAELGRLLREGGMSLDLSSGGAFPSVKAGSIMMGKEGNPSMVGQQIAKAVYDGIGRNK